MSILSDIEIRAFMDTKDIQIKHFDESCLEPASYDCKIGRVLVAGKGVVDPAKERVVLRTGEWAEIETLEEIKLSTKMAASYGIRSSITRKGLDWFGGPQIDPGYRGKIYISIFNASSIPFEIESLMPFCSLIFHQLGKEASRGYSGKHQNLTHFPEEDIERMIKMETTSLADVVISVSILDKTVMELTNSTKRMAHDIGWIKNLLFAILIAGVIGIAISVVNKFI